MKISPIVSPSRGTGASVSRVGDHQPFEHRVAHPLARLEPGALVVGQRVPFVVPGADHGRAVDLGQAVDMGDAEAERLDAADHRGGRRGAGGHHLDRARQLRVARH